MKKLHLFQRKGTVTKNLEQGWLLIQDPWGPWQKHVHVSSPRSGRRMPSLPSERAAPHPPADESPLFLQDLRNAAGQNESLPPPCSRCPPDAALWFWIPVSDARRLETTAQSPLFLSQDRTKGLAPRKPMLQKSLKPLDRMIDSTSIPSAGNFIWRVLQA